jgi:hypothetical protein
MGFALPSAFLMRRVPCWGLGLSERCPTTSRHQRRTRQSQDPDGAGAWPPASRSDGGFGDRAAGVAQHRQAPPFADQFKRPGGGALLILVEASKHMDKIAAYLHHATMDHTCMMQAKCEVPMLLKGCQSF